MLSKKERLTRQDFSRFFSSGRRYHSSFFTLVYTPSPALHASVVVPKKVVPKAVDRNTIRRRLYSTLRGEHGVFIVLLKKPGTLVAPEVLRESLRTEVGRLRASR